MTDEDELPQKSARIWEPIEAEGFFATDDQAEPILHAASAPDAVPGLRSSTEPSDPLEKENDAPLPSMSRESRGPKRSESFAENGMRSRRIRGGEWMPRPDAQIDPSDFTEAARRGMAVGSQARANAAGHRPESVVQPGSKEPATVPLRVALLYDMDSCHGPTGVTLPG